MRYADGPTTEAAARVAAPPRAVWALVTDPQFLVEVSTEMQRAEWVDGDRPGPGARLRGEHHHEARGAWSTVSTVTAWEPGRVFEWTVEAGAECGETAVWRFELTPDGDGTVLRQWARMGPGPSGLTAAIERWPDKEERIVEGRLREWRTGMERNLDAVRERLG
ncbi:SRPBCC family protein [Pseudonocardia sp. HH130629-09]|uniref:SRPBCC family protein n=1 Tax=Pseudonocardia sp. HH130629-09 TaxID=1641402 RepID=UPI0006CB3F89|nr:SRPBCC family protein [Pseudonocardia sp. HH130629-09]ALE83071.1 cyclase [Pseudonocardia sp. HH130629-09]